MKTILSLKRNAQENNPYRFTRIDFIQFNFDGKGSAIILEDGHVSTATEKTVSDLLFGGQELENEFESWYLPILSEDQVLETSHSVHKLNRNTCIFCKSIIIQRKLLFQKWKNKIKLNLDDVVKIEISAGEHGYVRIVRKHKNKFWGKIDVNPVSPSKEYDDLILFTIYDIQEVKEKFYFILSMDHYEEVQKKISLIDSGFKKDFETVAKLLFIESILLVVNNEVVEWVPRKVSDD
jgi:hypothetical protein